MLWIEKINSKTLKLLFFSHFSYFQMHCIVAHKYRWLSAQHFFETCAYGKASKQRFGSHTGSVSKNRNRELSFRLHLLQGWLNGLRQATIVYHILVFFTRHNIISYWLTHIISIIIRTRLFHFLIFFIFKLSFFHLTSVGWSIIQTTTHGWHTTRATQIYNFWYIYFIIRRSINY